MRRILVAAMSLTVCAVAIAGEGPNALSQSARTQTSSPSAQITVTGEVRTPGAVSHSPSMTVVAAIAQAGGVTADAAVIEIHHRTSGAGPVTADTAAREYQATYVVLGDLVGNAAPVLAGGDFVVVRRVLELHPPTPAGQFGAGAYRLDWAPWGVETPVVRTSSEPQYTRAGMALKLQGTVELEVVVKADGTVADARVVRGLDPKLPELVAELRRIGDAHAQSVLQIVGNGPIGLDANAIVCVRTWTFAPGTILGKATPVIHTVPVSFKLR